MFIAKSLLSTTQGQFQAGEVVPDVIASRYWRYVKAVIDENTIQVETVTDPTIETVTETVAATEYILPLSKFLTKQKLEDYGKTFGIDLDKRKMLKNMYSDLLEQVGK